MWLSILRIVFYTAPFIILTTAIMGTMSLVVSLFSTTGYSQHRLARFWSRVLLRGVGVKVVAEGLEKIPPGGSFVFIANHRSYFDVPVILPFISLQIRFIASKDLFSWPFIGFHLRRAGHIPVDRDNPRDALRSMAEAARIIQERKISVLLFPEGTRSHGEMLPFKDGAAQIAIKAGVPIIPISLDGVREIMPRGSLMIRGGTVKLKVGDPIPTIDLSMQDRSRLTQRLQEIITGMLEESGRQTASKPAAG